jgi:Abnormal spindle-like microcephaly-assoc'd, ASPM-SPD-2-Hydin
MGQRSGTLTITDDDQGVAGSTHTVTLDGTGIAPVASLSSATLYFAGQVVGTAGATEELTVSNSGTAPLHVTEVAISGPSGSDFAQTNTCNNPVAAGANCTVTIAFTPSSGGARSGTLTLTDDDGALAGSVQTVTLAGTGIDFSIAVVAGTPSTRTVTAGAGTSFVLSVAALGGFNQAVSLACTGAPSKAICTVSPASVTLDGISAQNVSVTVTTTAASIAALAPRDGPPPAGILPMHEWWIALLLLMGTLALAFTQRPRCVPLLAGAVLLAAIAISCGGGGGMGGSGGTTKIPGTPAGTYPLTVTATSGSLSHSTTVSLTVQ